MNSLKKFSSLPAVSFRGFSPCDVHYKLVSSLPIRDLVPNLKLEDDKSPLDQPAANTNTSRAFSAAPASASAMSRMDPGSSTDASTNPLVSTCLTSVSVAASDAHHHDQKELPSQPSRREDMIFPKAYITPPNRPVHNPSRFNITYIPVRRAADSSAIPKKTSWDRSKTDADVELPMYRLGACTSLNNPTKKFHTSAAFHKDDCKMAKKPPPKAKTPSKSGPSGAPASLPGRPESSVPGAKGQIIAGQSMSCKISLPI